MQRLCWWARQRRQPEKYQTVADVRPRFHGAKSLYKELPYDPRKDFAPIALVVRVPFILVVNPSLPIESVGDLISYAKAHPGALTYGSGGAGSPHQLFASGWGMVVAPAHTPAAIVKKLSDAVGRGFGAIGGADRRSCAGPVFDHDRLAEQFADAGSKFAAYRVDRSGRRPGCDQGNATRRIIIALRRRDRKHQTGSKES